MRTFVLAFALVLAIVPAAAAKEIKKAEVCGPGGCSIIAEGRGRAILLDGAGPPRTPPTAAPYYDVRVTMQEGDTEGHWSLVAVPARHAMRADDGSWLGMSREQTELVAKVAAGRRPYPASGLVGWAAPRDPKPAAAGGGDSPLPGAKPGSLLPGGVWPEGVVVALIAIGTAFAARAVWLRGAARRA